MQEFYTNNVYFIIVASGHPVALHSSLVQSYLYSTNVVR